MQDHQVDDKNFMQSQAIVVSYAEQEFNPGRQTAEIVPEEGMEFVQTHYSPRGVVLLYFRGGSETEVDRHFNRTFAELCCLPGSPENNMDNSHFQERPNLPMSQRNLPASFWNPSHTIQFQQLQSAVGCQSDTVNKFQQSHNSTNHYNNRYHRFTPGQHDILQPAQNTPSWAQARAIPVSYAQLPVGTFTTFTSGFTQQMSSDSCRAPAPPFTQKFSAHLGNAQTDSLRCNPGYNALLVEPEVRPHLPAVPGEPPTKQNGRDKCKMEDFPSELLTRNGEN